MSPTPSSHNYLVGVGAGYFGLQCSERYAQLALAFKQRFGHAARRREAGGTGDAGGRAGVVVQYGCCGEFRFKALYCLVRPIKARRKIGDPTGEHFHPLLVVD